MTGKNENFFARALSRRLQPNGPLHPKQLAHALFPADPDAAERFQRSIYNHAAGASKPDYDALRLYLGFFQSDPSFLMEAFPEVRPLLARLRQADRILDAVRGADPDLTPGEGAAAPGGAHAAGPSPDEGGGPRRRTVPREAA